MIIFLVLLIFWILPFLLCSILIYKMLAPKSTIKDFIILVKMHKALIPVISWFSVQCLFLEYVETFDYLNRRIK